MPNLYALLIGIDDYQYISPLGGCEKDIRKVHSFLESFTEGKMTFHPKTLFNKEATKANIVQTFRSHLTAQAQSGDIALLYYSGHGAQEDAADVWSTEEPDGKLEGIVCHDTGIGKGVPLLADKELRFLIHELSKTGAEILTFFDSCHAGDNTRNMADAPKRRVAAVLPTRKWEEFIFADRVSEEDVQHQRWADKVPEGRHVQIAACEDMEFAYENSEGGIFTNTMLQLLKEKEGKITYYDLQSQVKFKIKGVAGGINQTPRVYATPEHHKDIFKVFLGSAIHQDSLSGSIVYNANNKQWIYDKGGIHGVHASQQDNSETLVIVPVKGKKSMYAFVKDVKPAYSIVEFEEGEEIDKGMTYQGHVAGLMSAPLNVFIAGVEDGTKVLHAIFEEQKIELEKHNIFLVDKREEADYEAQAVELKDEKDGHIRRYFILSLPGDHRPLTVQKMGFSLQAATEIVRDLQSIVTWQFIKKLHNPDEEALTHEDIKLEFLQQEQAVPIVDRVIKVEYDDKKYNETWKFDFPFTKVKVKLTNTTEQPLYVACLYMDTDFSTTPRLMRPDVVRLNPGESVFARSGKTITLPWELPLRQFNYKEDQFYFKVIVSTEAFTTFEFTLDGLEKPVFPWPDRSALTGKGLTWDEEEDEKIKSETWQATLYTVKVPNPFYQEA
ncbi:MAG: caspase family protein [Bacteroidota bacterium]